MSGLDYAVNRYYASAWGRFTSVDPTGARDQNSQQSLNRYGYALGDPVNRSDPSGLCVRDDQGDFWDTGDEVAEDWGSGDCLANPEFVLWANAQPPGSFMLNGAPYYPFGDNGGPDSGSTGTPQPTCDIEQRRELRRASA